MVLQAKLLSRTVERPEKKIGFNAIETVTPKKYLQRKFSASSTVLIIYSRCLLNTSLRLNTRMASNDNRRFFFTTQFINAYSSKVIRKYSVDNDRSFQ